ncbi:conserved hypothetical protein [uncultured Desulfobacterium sp.]|uniref:Transposase IS200-like domain-containing protein n=1 Tax=uncultured Desulfobacterium sp. TaxID=201089 RepID=A0A445N1Q7_9BACT|nr:conserved hypothetical protein [uncultured Desulfobacterium sp.]
MPRIARMVVKGEPSVYHIISRTALEGYVIGDVEKEFLLKLIKRLSSIYFAEVVGFCLMGSHFHLLVRMHPGEEYPDDEIKRRFKLMYGDESEKRLSGGQIPLLRMKWASLSEYVKEIKQGFSRFYNKLHHRKGFFWSDRFKSIIVDNGDTLINCLAYIDLNPVRAGIVEKPEQYRWNSLGYHLQTNNKDDFLSLDFGLKEFGVKTPKDRLRLYRGFVYGNDLLQHKDEKVAATLELSAIEKFRYRSRYFTDSGIIGTKAFVTRHYQAFKHLFSSKHEKRPKTIRGLDGIYSLKRLTES